MRGYYLVAGAVLGGVYLMSKKVLEGGPNPIVVQRIAEAIAKQEGPYIQGKRSFRNHNPGNLTMDIGPNTVHPIGRDGIYMVYANDADGWEDLRQQIRLWLTGKSKVIFPDMSLAEVAGIYTRTEQLAWAANVARFLGVTVTTKLSELV